MKILTVRQPWAYLLAAGIKPVENRSWSTSYRGMFMIHAASRPATMSYEEIERRYGVTLPQPAFVFSAIVGVARLAGVHRKRRGDSKWAEGPWCWTVADARLLTPPLPFTGGTLGLRDAESGVVRAVNHRLFVMHDSRR